MVVLVVAQLLRGFCMGAADIVPGVSGGTVALVFGIYERLIANVQRGASVLGRLVRLDFDEAWAHFRSIDWLFLVPLLAGIGTAVLALSHAIEAALEDHPVPMAALFFGLVIASIVITWGHLRKRDGLRMGVLAATAVVTFFLLGLRTDETSDPSLAFVFVAGAIAICAMILPGISGSFLLLMMGLYDYVLGSLNDRDIAVIAVFGIGAVVGLASFSSLLQWLLKHHHDTVVAALVGLMAGSLRVLWPWPSGTENADLAWPTASEVPLAIVIAAGAAVAVFVLARVSERALSEDKTDATTSADEPAGP